MIFDMLKRLRSVVYLPNDYVCKKVSCVGSVPAGPGTVSAHPARQPCCTGVLGTDKCFQSSLHTEEPAL